MPEQTQTQAPAGDQQVEQNFTPEQKASYQAGARKTAKEYGALMAEKDAEIERLKAERDNPPQDPAQQQAQQPTQPQSPAPAQQAQPPVNDPNLQVQMAEIQYNQQRQEAVDTHIADNPADIRLRGSVMELSKQEAYKNVPTQHIFAIARASNPDPQTPPVAPSAQQLSNDAAKSTVMRGQENMSVKDRINQARVQSAKERGVRPDLIK